MQMKLIELDHDGGSNCYFSATMNLVPQFKILHCKYVSVFSKKLNGFLEKYTHPNGIRGTTCNTAYLIANKSFLFAIKNVPTNVLEYSSKATNRYPTLIRMSCHGIT